MTTNEILGALLLILGLLASTVVFPWWFYKRNKALDVYVGGALFNAKTLTGLLIAGMLIPVCGALVDAYPNILASSDMAFTLMGLFFFIIFSPILFISGMMSGWGIVGGVLYFIALAMATRHSGITFEIRMQEAGHGNVYIETERPLLERLILFCISIMCPLYFIWRVRRAVKVGKLKLTNPRHVGMNGPDVYVFRQYTVDLPPLREVSVVDEAVQRAVSLAQTPQQPGYAPPHSAPPPPSAYRGAHTTTAPAQGPSHPAGHAPTNDPPPGHVPQRCPSCNSSVQSGQTECANCGFDLRRSRR